MTQILRQSTAVDVILGPFLDSTDGDTDENALTISQADVRLSKNGQNFAQKSDVTACLFDEIGMYNCELDATDTNTIGQLTIVVHETGALSVRQDYQVIEEAAYDAIYAASADPVTNTDLNARTLASASYFDPAADAVANVTLTATVTTLTNLPSIPANWLTAAGINAAALNGKGDWNTTTPPTVDAIADQVWDELMAGHVIADSAGLVQNDWQDGGRLDVILDAASAPTVAQIADAVWDEPLVAHTGADAAGLVMNEWQNGGRLDTIIDNILVDTGVIGTAGAGLTDVGGLSLTARGQVGDACWDEALALHTGGDSAGLVLNEWQDGGRLDVILDARMAEASISTTGGAVDTVTTNTDMRGTDGVDTATMRGTDSAALASLQSLFSGTADAGGSTTTIVDAALTEVNLIWRGCMVLITSGASANQRAIVSDFDAASDTLTFAPVLENAIGAGITYELLPWTSSDVELHHGVNAPALAGIRYDASVGFMQSGVIDAFALNADFTAAIADGVLDEVITPHTTTDSFGEVLINLAQGLAGLVTGAAVGTPTTTVIDTDLTEDTDDHYNGRIFTITSGVGAGQSVDITDYNGTTKEVTVTALITAPVATDTFVIS